MRLVVLQVATTVTAGVIYLRVSSQGKSSGRSALGFDRNFTVLSKHPFGTIQCLSCCWHCAAIAFIHGWTSSCPCDRIGMLSKPAARSMDHFVTRSKTWSKGEVGGLLRPQPTKAEDFPGLLAVEAHTIHCLQITAWA